MTPQPQISANCQPVADSDGTLTLTCAGTITNPGPETLVFAVAGLVPGQTAFDLQNFTLRAGMSQQLPTPPAGGAWVICWETTQQIALQDDLALAGAVLGGTLMGVGAADLVIAIARGVGRARARARARGM